VRKVANISSRNIFVSKNGQFKCNVIGQALRISEDKKVVKQQATDKHRICANSYLLTANRTTENVL